jgi:N-acetylmuramoyl-L-alanine amidase
MDTIALPPFIVAGHRLHNGDAPAPWRVTPNLGGTIRPEIIVLHETASRLDSAGSISWLCNPAAKASAHLVIGRDGIVTQLAPFNRSTWHAGKSSYKGRPNVNGFSIGMELVGPGQMVAGAYGHSRAWFGAEYGIEEHGIQRVQTPEHGNGLWMPFTTAQIAATNAIAKLLVEAYRLKDITTHWAIAPRRKVDPNPLFPLARCRELALGAGAAPMGRA